MSININYRVNKRENKKRFVMILSLSIFFICLLPECLRLIPALKLYISSDSLTRLVMLYAMICVFGFVVFYCVLKNKTNGVILYSKDVEKPEDQNSEYDIELDSPYEVAVILAKHIAIWFCLYQGAIVFFFGLISIVVAFSSSHIIGTAYYVNIPYTSCEVDLLYLLQTGVAIFFLQRRLLSQPIKNKFKLDVREN